MILSPVTEGAELCKGHRAKGMGQRAKDKKQGAKSEGQIPPNLSPKRET